MADFFNDFSKMVTNFADDFSRKAEETVEVQKLKSDIRSLRRANTRDYEEIGRMVYEKFQNDELKELDFITICGQIESREDEIEIKEEEIVKIQGA